MVLIKRLLIWNCLNVQLSLIKIIFGLKFVVPDTLFGKPEHIELSDVVKNTFIVIDCKGSADQVWLIIILEPFNVSIDFEDGFGM